MRRTATLALFMALAASWSGCKRCGGEPTADPSGTGNPAAEPVERTPAVRKAPRKEPPPAGKPNDKVALGTNVGSIGDWSTAVPFIDAFRSARKPWTSGAGSTWDDGRTIAVDEHGWIQKLEPGQVARVLMLTDAHARPGKYIVLYEGKGEIQYWDAASHLPGESKPGRDVIRVKPTGGVKLNIQSVDPADPLRNMHVIPEGGACADDHAIYCDGEQPCPSGECLAFEEHYEELVFHPDYLARTQPFGMLRFMDMMGTNNSEVVHWDDRPKLDDASWQGGAPLEVMAQLANTLHAQPWFCIPHQADDDYVRHFAEQAKALVDPELPIWIEYSNEVWNGIFKQASYVRELGGKLGYGSDYAASAKAYGHRAKEIFEIFEDVLGKERLVSVVAGQAGNAGVAGIILEQSGVAEHADALAIAPYFGWTPSPDEADKVRSLSVDDLVRHAREKSIPETIQWTEQHAQIAAKYRLQLVAYEGGQHYLGAMGLENDEKITSLFSAFNRDPRMGELYKEYLDGWRKAGGQWFNHYSDCALPSKWGSWGAMETIRQPVALAPKYEALLTWMENNPRWW